MRKTPFVAILLLLVISLPICTASEMNLVWDLNGNLVSGDGKYRIYNGLNQLTHIFNGSNSSAPLLETYKYHPVEERIWVKKVYNVSDSNHILETVMYVNENSVRVINSSGTFDFTYVLHAGGMIAQNVSGITHFIHSDPGSAVQKILTDISGNIIENTSFDPQGNILEGGSNRFDMEDREYSSITGDYDFRFRKYDPDLGIFTKPDTLIQNVYMPQSLNRYMFERGNPIKYNDPDGHIAQYALPGIVGFVAGSLGYMMTHSGSGWSHVGNTYAAGLAGAATAVGTVAFATTAGAATGAAGGLGATVIAGKFVVGALGELTSELLAGDDPSTQDILMGGLTNILSVKGLSLKPGSFVGTKNLLTKNNLKLGGDVVAGSIAFNTYAYLANYFSNANSVNSQQQQVAARAQEQARQEIIKQAGSGSYSGGSGYNAGAGAYVTEGGKVYPTNNPNWKPCGCATNAK